IQIFKGIFLVVLIDALAKFLGLKTVQYFADIFLNWGFLALIIVFQPEIRSLLERLGKSNVFSRITTLTGNEKEELVRIITRTAVNLSRNMTGALITIEQGQSLDDYIATGIKLNSNVTQELLTSIFVTTTPLHDGAVIIQGDKIACASAYFPPTNLELPSRYGARHRAAFGISEITDAVTVVVSEETGQISITQNGQMHHVDEKELYDYLTRVICGEESEVKGQKPQPAGREVLIAQDRPREKQNLSDTTVLRKLALKKQENPEKIETEEVVSGGVVHKTEHEEVPQIRVAEEEKPAKKKRRGLLSRKPKKPEVKEEKRFTDDTMTIKMPVHSKETTPPAYPQTETTERFEQERREQARRAREAYLAAQAKAAEEAPVKAPETPAEPAVQEAEQPARMTMEDVRRAREASLRRLKNKEEEVSAPQEAPAVQENPKEAEQPSSLYDTTKLDVSAIVGLDKELQQTLNMVDELTDVSGNRNGGER
ncbi:MAG: diadenylate cyclase CdaA, partial [Solobacterium sp.]|nr:diadenylate cyclase CdaA [Solobacterium sp.]